MEGTSAMLTSGSAYKNASSLRLSVTVKALPHQEL